MRMKIILHISQTQEEAKEDEYGKEGDQEQEQEQEEPYLVQQVRQSNLSLSHTVFGIILYQHTIHEVGIIEGEWRC